MNAMYIINEDMVNDLFITYTPKPKVKVNFKTPEEKISAMAKVLDLSKGLSIITYFFH